MWRTSDAFDTALHSRSRRWASKVEVLYGGDLVTTLNVVVDGDVSIDNVAVRRAVDLRLIDIDGTLTPATANDLLAPKGTELRVYKGLWLNDVDIEYVPLGVFGIVEPQVSAHENGTQVKLKGWDRVDAIRVRQFEDPYTVAAGTSTTDAIRDIITSRLDVEVRVTPTGHTAPESVFDALTDPWDAVRDLAFADGLIAYFDPLGTGVVEPEIEVMTDAEYIIGEGSHLVSTNRKITADKTYSGVIVRGEHPEAGAFRSELWDTDPASPTYADGPFGRRPYGFYSKLITSQGMADETALTIYNRVTKMKQTVEIITIGHPGHDVGDVVRVIDSRSRTNGLYRVVAGTIPIRPGQIRLRLEDASTNG
jgi:hypothetical protein